MQVFWDSFCYAGIMLQRSSALAAVFCCWHVVMSQSGSIVVSMSDVVSAGLFVCLTRLQLPIYHTVSVASGDREAEVHLRLPFRSNATHLASQGFFLIGSKVPCLWLVASSTTNFEPC